MARCARGSRRYRALRRLKARHELVAARRRREELQRWTTSVARRFRDLTVVAPASIAEATASGRGTARDPGAAVATKAAVNRHVLDQAPAAAMAMLAYKIAEARGSFTRVDDDRAPINTAVIVVETAKQSRRAMRSARRQRKDRDHVAA